MSPSNGDCLPLVPPPADCWSRVLISPPACETWSVGRGLGVSLTAHDSQSIHVLTRAVSFY